MPFAAAAGIAAVGTVAGSAISASAAKSGAKKSIAAQQAAQEQAREDLSPYMDAGGVALERQNALLGLAGPEAAATAMADFTTAPAYEWEMEQGLRAIDAGAASRGMLRSGATIKAEQAFGQNLARQDFGTYYGRINQLAEGGRQAAAAAAGQAITTGSNIAQTQASLGGTLAGISANAAQGVGNAVQQGYSNYAADTAYTGRTNALMYRG